MKMQVILITLCAAVQTSLACVGYEAKQCHSATNYLTDVHCVYGVFCDRWYYDVFVWESAGNNGLVCTFHGTKAYCYNDTIPDQCTWTAFEPVCRNDCSYDIEEHTKHGPLPYVISGGVCEGS
jgi:hypothetical protein